MRYIATNKEFNSRYTSSSAASSSRRVGVVVLCDTGLTDCKGSLEGLILLLECSDWLGCDCCWIVAACGEETGIITDTVNSFSDLVDGIMLLHHEAAEFLDVVCNWSCGELEHRKIFLLCFVEVHRESCLGFVRC